MENKDLAFQARSPIIHITVKGNLLYCSTLKDSLSVIEFNPEDNSLKACISDPKPRLSTFHFVFQDHIIVTDKLGDMIGLAGDGMISLASYLNDQWLQDTKASMKSSTCD